MKRVRNRCAIWLPAIYATVLVGRSFAAQNEGVASRHPDANDTYTITSTLELEALDYD